MYKHIIMALLLSAALPAAGQTLAAQVAEAEALLHANQPDAALAMFQQLQVDHPRAPEVVLGLGAAQYRQAELAIGAGRQEQARQQFAQAQETFQRLLNDERATVRRHAGFNYANAVAKEARAYDTQRQYEEQIQVLRRAVNAFEVLIEDFPGDTEVQQNLDHVRYVLKRLLQNPPEDPDEEKVPLILHAVTELENKEAVVTDNRVELVDATEAQPGTEREQP